MAELPLVATSQDVQGLVGLRIALQLKLDCLFWSCGLVLCSLLDVSPIAVIDAGLLPSLVLVHREGASLTEDQALCASSCT